MNDAYIDKRVFSDVYLGKAPELYDLCIEVCRGLEGRGWEIYQYNPPKTEGLPCLLVVFVRMQGKRTRRMTVLFGREWTRETGQMINVARVQELAMFWGTRQISLPLTGDYAVHVHQYDPCLTATVLNTLSDDEIEADYDPTVMIDRAFDSMRSTAADTLESMKVGSLK